MAMAAIPAGIAAAAGMAGTAATVLGAGKQAYDIGKEYGPGAIRAARAAKKMANKAGRKEYKGRLKAAAKAFKKAPSKERAAMAKGAIKKAYEKTSKAVKDVGELGKISSEVGKKTGSKRATAAGESLSVASNVGKIHLDTASKAADSAKKSWHESIGTHNKEGPGNLPGKHEILGTSRPMYDRVGRPDPAGGQRPGALIGGPAAWDKMGRPDGAGGQRPGRQIGGSRGG